MGLLKWGDKARFLPTEIELRYDHFGFLGYIDVDFSQIIKLKRVGFTFEYLSILWLNVQAYDQHLNMILGDVEEIVTTVEIDDETYEEIVRVCSTSNFHSKFQSSLFWAFVFICHSVMHSDCCH